MARSARRRKNKAQVVEEIDPDTPRIIVIRRGALRQELRQLVRDLRLLLSPNCATNLNEASRQKMKDFTEVSEVLSLTHIIAVSETDRGCYLKVASLPKGPTLTFSIDLLTLVSDIAKHTFNPKSIGGTCNYSPLVVLNGFNVGEGSNGNASEEDQASAMKTVGTTLNKLFSPIDVSTTKMINCKRVVLFNKDRASDNIAMRHYLINLVDCNTSGAVQDLVDKRSLKRLISDRNATFSDFINDSATGNDVTSSLREEYVELHNVDPGDLLLRHKYGLKNTVEFEEINDGNQKVAVSLTEAGPRLNLRLIKIQEGVFSGSVKFHKYVHKTREEIEKLEAAFREKRRLEQEAEASKKAKANEDDGDKSNSAEDCSSPDKEL